MVLRHAIKGEIVVHGQYKDQMVLAFINAGRKQGKKITGYEYSVLVINTDHEILSLGQLFHGAKEIVLTPKEFGLIALFARRVGCALTRDEILRKVWGYDILVTTHSVDRCVNTLRGKIENNPNAPIFIKPIRDVGY